MNEKIQTWIKALRSGEYKQGFDKLRSLDDRFCCLGVLCDLHSKETGTKWLKTKDVLTYGYPEFKMADLEEYNQGFLPHIVRTWAGLPDSFGHTGLIPQIGLLGTSLTGLNDYGLTFSQIADVIEKEFLNETGNKNSLAESLA